MLPSIQKKMMRSTEFKELCLAAMASVVKNTLDRFTVESDPNYRAPLTVADKKTLDWCRSEIQRASLFDYSSPGVIKASPKYVVSILSLFDDTEADDLKYNDDNSIDWDLSKSIIMDKVTTSGYLSGLAGCIEEDYTTAI